MKTKKRLFFIMKTEADISNVLDAASKLVNTPGFMSKRMAAGKCGNIHLFCKETPKTFTFEVYEGGEE